VKNFSANLLFQFRVVVEGKASARRICEERIVMFASRNARTAVAAANRIGTNASYTYVNDEGNPVHFEFVGVRDMMCLGPECEPGVVWYTVSERLQPMERKNRLVLSPQEQLERASR